MAKTKTISQGYKNRLSEETRKLRGKKNQREFAHLLGIESHGTIGRWERKEIKSHPDRENLQKLADLKGCTLSELEEYLEGGESPISINIPVFEQMRAKLTDLNLVELIQLSHACTAQILTLTGKIDSYCITNHKKMSHLSLRLRRLLQSLDFDPDNPNAIELFLMGFPYEDREEEVKQLLKGEIESVSKETKQGLVNALAQLGCYVTLDELNQDEMCERTN